MPVVESSLTLSFFINTSVSGGKSELGDYGPVFRLPFDFCF